MKDKKIVLFLIIASLIFLSACAKNYGPGAKTSVISVSECLDCSDTVNDLRRILNSASGIFNYYIDKEAATIRITYDSTVTSADKLAQLIREGDFTVGWVEHKEKVW